MKNTEEAALISAISGPWTKDLDKLVESVLRKTTPSDSAFNDPAVGIVYQEVIRGYFTPDIIAKALPSISNAQKFQDFERLAMCVVKMYEMMDTILECLRNKHKTREAEIFTNYTKHILNRAADSLNEKFYYKVNLAKVIDDMLYDLESTVAMQEAIRLTLDDQELERSQALKKADFEKALSSRKNIDCGVNRFSDLTGLGLSRLITKVTSADSVVFDFINFEGNLREVMKRAIQRTDCCNDKYVFFYLNDRRRIKHFDFFKVILIEIESNMKAKKTEICYFEDHPTQLDKQQVMHSQYYLEDNSSSTLKFDTSYDNKMEVLFEDEVTVYNIQSKLLLAVYQIIFKQFVIDKLRTDFFKQHGSDIPKVTITIENLYDFFSFLKSGRTGMSTFDPSQMKMMESGFSRGGPSVRVNNFVSPSALEDRSRYDVHHSLLDTYGNRNENIDGSIPARERQIHNSMRPQSSQLPQSFLQSVLLANQKKLEGVDEGSRRRQMGDYVNSGNLAHSQNIDPSEVEKQRAERMARMQEEKAERERRAAEAAAQRDADRQRMAEQSRLQAEQDRRERDERERKARDEREERERKVREEREQNEKKAREEREERERKLKEEREKREQQERERREVWEKEEREKREAREQAAKEQAEKDRLAREAREQAAKEQAEKDRQAREAREQAAKEQAEKDRQAREAREQAAREQAQRERDARDQAAKEQAERDRQAREAREQAAREQAEKDRLAREAQEKADRERREQEARDRAERERQDAERTRIANEKAAEEYRQEMARREAAEQARLANEREAEEYRLEQARKEAAEQARLQNEREAEEYRLAMARKEKEEADRLQREADAEKERLRLAKEKKEREEQEERDRLAAEAAEAERKKKEAESSKKDEIDDFDDDFGNIDDEFGDFDDELAGSTEKKKTAKPPSKPPSPKADSKATTSKPATQKEIVTKKNAPADEEFDFGDDFDDDFLNDDLEESKKSKAKPEPPKKEEPKPQPAVEEQPSTTAFAGGLRGLKKKSDENKISQPEKAFMENPLGHERVVKSVHLPLIDAYIRATSPLDEEQIQQVMSTMVVDHQMITLIFNEFIRNQTVFIMDYEQTNEILQIWASSIEDNGRLDTANINQLGKMLGQLLQGTFENEPFDKIKYFFCPFIEIGEVQEEGVVQAMVDLRNKQVFIVSLNPEMNEEAARSSPNIHMFANILAKTLKVAMDGKDDIDIPASNIFVADLQPQLHQFLVESCEGQPEPDEDGEGESMGYPYLRLMMITYLTLFEPATDRLDFDGFKKSLGIEAFELENAGRFVATMNSVRESLSLRMQLPQTPELADGLMQTVEAIVAEKKCQVIPKLAEKVTQPAEVEDAISEDLKQLNELRKTSDKVFAVLEYLFTEEGDQKLLYFMALQKDEPDVVMYLGLNQEPENKKCLGIIETSLSRASGQKPKIMYEHHRHQFSTDNVDIFTYCWPILVYEMNLKADDALRCLVYNELAFVSELMQGMMAGDEEQNPNDMAIGMEDSNERGIVEDPNGGDDDNIDDFGDDDFDFDDMDNAAPKATKPADNKRPTSALPNVTKGKTADTKPKQSNIDYDFDDDEFGDPVDNKGGDDFDDNFDDLDF
jgi:hypothetical protein